MISKKEYKGDGSNKRFLSDFIIRSEQFARPYVYIYDNTLPSDGTGDVLQDGTTDQANWSFPDNIWKRGYDAPKSSDLVTADKWQVVDNSVLFFDAPTSGTIVWIEVATTASEFGDTLVAPSAAIAEAAAELAVASRDAAAISEANAKTSETNAQTSEINAKTSEANSKTSETNSKTSETNAQTSEANAKTSETNAYTKATEAATSASNASTSEDNAATSEANAKTSETNAKTSEINAKASADSVDANNIAHLGDGSLTNPLDGTFGRLSSPLLDLPLKNSLAMKAGVGSVTFTRSTTATYIDRYCVLQTAAIDEPRFEKDGLLIEGASTNLTLYSEDETNWGLTKTTSSRDTAIPNPYGVLDSIKITGDGTTGEHFAERADTVSSSTDTYTASIFIKPVENDTIQFDMYFTGGTTAAYYSSVTFSTLTVTGSGNGTVTPVGNGWYRVTATGSDNGSGNNTVRWRAYVDGGSSSSTSTASIYLLGGQVEQLPFASSYIPTTDAAVTRGVDTCEVDYNNNVTENTGNVSYSVDSSVIGNVGAIQSIFEKSVGLYNLSRYEPDNRISVYASGSTSIVSSSWVANITKNIVIVYTKDFKLSAYDDGVNTINEKDFIYNNTDGTYKLVLGARNNYLNCLWGHIKNFKIYDFAITPTEAKLLGGKL